MSPTVSADKMLLIIRAADKKRGMEKRRLKTGRFVRLFNARTLGEPSKFLTSKDNSIDSDPVTIKHLQDSSIKELRKL
jgi:hypothetical protein